MGDAELRLDDRARLAGRPLAVGEQLQDPAPDRIAEDVERVHGASISAVTHISQALDLSPGGAHDPAGLRGQPGSVAYRGSGLLAGAARRRRTPAPTATAATAPDAARTTGPGSPKSFSALASSTTTRATRTSAAGARADSRAPISTPGIEPASTAPAMSRCRSPKKACPSAAAVTSGTAWTRSVPTRSLARRVGYSVRSTTMISEPEPTEVRPTTRPPTAPSSAVGSGRTRTGPGSPGPAARRRVLTSRPSAALGTLPTHSQPTSDQATVPRRACTRPPKGFITALAARSLETAAIGGTPNRRTRIGVIRAPPPMPVSPTTTPTPRPARTITGSIGRVSAARPGIVY